MEKTFENFKKYIVTKAKEIGACSGEYKKAYKSENFKELLQVIKDNYNWCYDANLFTKEKLIELVPNDIMIENGFYYDYNGIIDNEKTIFIYDGVQDIRGNATIQDVRGNATIQDVRGNATVHNVRDNATVHNVRGNATVHNVRDNATVKNVRDNGIYRKLNIFSNEKPKLYLKRNSFEIIEIDYV